MPRASRPARRPGWSHDGHGAYSAGFAASRLRPHDAAGDRRLFEQRRQDRLRARWGRRSASAPPNRTSVRSRRQSSRASWALVTPRLSRGPGLQMSAAGRPTLARTVDHRRAPTPTDPRHSKRPGQRDDCPARHVGVPTMARPPTTPASDGRHPPLVPVHRRDHEAPRRLALRRPRGRVDRGDLRPPGGAQAPPPRPGPTMLPAHNAALAAEVAAFEQELTMIERLRRRRSIIVSSCSRAATSAASAALSRATSSARVAAAAPSLAWRAKIATIHAAARAAQSQPTRRFVIPAMDSDERSIPSEAASSAGAPSGDTDVTSGAIVSSSGRSEWRGSVGVGARRSSTVRGSVVHPQLTCQTRPL